MHQDAQSTRRAAAERDGARARVRRFTGGAVFASVAVVGTIASYVAHGTTHKKAVVATPATTVAPRRAAPAPKTQTVAVPDTPPAPSILAPGESPPQVSQPAQPSVPVQSSQPVSPPVAVQAPPVVVSGGS
jgi:hypothetical protein